MTKEMTLRLPDNVFEVIKKYKDMFGISHTNFIYNAIVWYCVSKNLISLRDFNGNYKKKLTIKKDSKNLNTMPNGIKFCDGDSCERQD